MSRACVTEQSRDRMSSGRLRFKGGGAVSRAGSDERKKRKKDDEADAAPVDGWVRVEADDDMVGPLFLMDGSKELCMGAHDAKPVPVLKRVTTDEQGRHEPDDVCTLLVVEKWVGRGEGGEDSVS